MVFEPDGWDVRARVGLLVPDGDVGPESEWSAMAPPGVRVHAGRFRFPTTVVAGVDDHISVDPVSYVAAPGPLDDAVKLLAHAPVNMFALAFTSTSYVGGEGDDPALIQRLGALTSGRPLVTTGQAILTALSRLGASRVLLVDPPWFPPPLTAMGAQWLERNGVEVLNATAAALPSGQGNVHPGGLYQWVRSSIPDGTEAVVVAGNGFRAVGAIARLEHDLGVSVITANSALLWLTLRTLGLPTEEVSRYGRLFARRPEL